MEYNDLSDSGVFNPENNSEINTFYTKHFVWSRDDFIVSEESVELSVSSHKYSYKDMNRPGLFSLVFKSFPDRGHGPNLPHLLHSANCSQVDLVLKDVTTNKTYSNSRFVIEMLLVSQEDKNETMSIDTKKSLDDEHTPGIFEIIELLTPSSRTSYAGGFVQYRPVSYTVKEREVASSTEIHHTAVVNIVEHKLNNSLASAFYGFNLDKYLVQGLNVSFGLKGDGFYKKSNYTTWTFTVGYGAPPEEKFSLLVILVISIGLGLPFLLMLIGGVYFCSRRCVRSSHDTIITN